MIDNLCFPLPHPRRLEIWITECPVSLPLSSPDSRLLCIRRSGAHLLLWIIFSWLRHLWRNTLRRAIAACRLYRSIVVLSNVTLNLSISRSRVASYTVLQNTTVLDTTEWVMCDVSDVSYRRLGEKVVGDLTPMLPTPPLVGALFFTFDIRLARVPCIWLSTYSIQ